MDRGAAEAPNQAPILAVGDIHGRLDLLERVFGEVLPQCPPATTLVFLGDYMDRGPDSAGVVERLLELARQRPETVFLKGNHEALFLNALDGDPVMREVWLRNGGLQTLLSYGLTVTQLDRFPPAHLDFLRGLALYHAAGGYVFAHAGMRPGVPLEDQSEKDLLWIREDFFASDWKPERTVVFGHTPFDAPFRRPGMIGLDTGAVFGGALSCLLLPQERFFRLEAQPQ